MPKTFPFYRPLFDFTNSIVYDVITKTVTEFLKVNDDATELIDPNTLAEQSYQYGEILKNFIGEIKNRLLSVEYSQSADSISSYLNSKEPDEAFEKYYTITKVFESIKSSILNETNPDDKLVQALADAVLGAEEQCLTNAVYLLKYFGTNPESIQQYFANITTNDMPSLLKMCFQSIGVNGMRYFVYCIIEDPSKKYDIKASTNFRIYCEFFCLYINLLNDIPRSVSRKNIYPIVFALMKASYYDGQITREREFYSHESLQTMGSIGTSNSMKTSVNSSKKEYLYSQAEEEIRKRYKDGPPLRHNEMADEIKKMDRFKNLAKSRLLEIAKEEADKKGLVRGKKKKSDEE
jgi:hypothetical protein